MNTYEFYLRKIYHRNVKRDPAKGLEHMRTLMRVLGNPERSFLSVHVAGTNGKGSVAWKIAEACKQSGLKVGLYSSPHISTYRERIQVNHHMIEKDNINTNLQKIFNIIEMDELPLTFFDITTALAFLYFAEKKVDIAVIETGIGGRIDSTNVILPILSIITSIGLEHTEFLGHTTKEIACEKAGIVKENIPVVIGPSVNKEYILPFTKESLLFQSEKIGKDFEEENNEMCRLALRILTTHLPLSEDAIEKGLVSAPPCRFELIQRHRATILIDVAHNPHGINALFKRIQAQFPERNLHVIFGLSRSKDIEGCLQEISPYAKQIHLVTSLTERGIHAEELFDAAVQLGIPKEKLQVIPEIYLAIQKILNEIDTEDLLIICGSFFIMSEARRALGILEERDPLDINLK